VIIFGAESPSAQAFTMAHELAHIILQQSAISGAVERRDPKSAESLVEGWCNEFAAAFLMPSDNVMAMWSKPNDPVAALGDDTLQRMASAFKTSRHAMLIRLVNLGYVRPEYYWAVKRPQFDEEESNYKAFGRSRYYGSRFRSARGDLYTGLVLDAWASGLISNHNAAEFMGTKSIKHLEDIRREFTTQ
jgi:Zn-dependent peptidase ImmA (M78 family)